MNDRFASHGLHNISRGNMV